MLISALLTYLKCILLKRVILQTDYCISSASRVGLSSLQTCARIEQRHEKAGVWPVVTTGAPRTPPSSDNTEARRVRALQRKLEPGYVGSYGYFRASAQRTVKRSFLETSLAGDFGS